MKFYKIYYSKNLSKPLLISGTKTRIPIKTVGQATKNLSNHNIKKSPPLKLKKIITIETAVLVQNDIIMAKIINLYFIIKFYPN